jgi:hypothetical protein
MQSEPTPQVAKLHNTNLPVRHSQITYTTSLFWTCQAIQAKTGPMRLRSHHQTSIMTPMDKQDIRTLLTKVTRRRPASEIAAEIGIPASYIYELKSKGKMNRDNLDLLEAWLISHGHAPEQPTDVNHLLAADLEHLAAILRSKIYTPAKKAKIYRDRIETIHSSLDTTTNALQNQKTNK